jgi:histidine triad (HIT) family protein
MADDCIFCKIANGQIPVPLVYQDDLIAAFRDINPQAPTHILLVPRAHVPGVPALTGEDGPLLAALLTTAAALARQEGIAETGFRLVVNSGPDAGQTVDHLHVHLLGGRALGWPPG